MVAAHSLLILRLKVDSVRLTEGVPHIVPLLSPMLRPRGRSGSNDQLMMLPLIRVGVIWVI